jgi:succinoglycan biosynthesis protein ExoM
MFSHKFWLALVSMGAVDRSSPILPLVFALAVRNMNTVTNTPIITVLVPTFHRPEGALAAGRSVLAQVNAADFEILLVDNDVGQSGARAAQTLSQESHVPFRYAVEAAPGVANARNKAVSLANGDFIAFLDDDEVAKPNWLHDMMAAHIATGADVVFGPIEARLPANSAQPHAYFKAFFSRLLDGETRLIEKPFGCGNSLLKRDTVLRGPTPFNPATNETGGEDDLLWQDVRAWGGTFGWAHTAWVYEDVPESRASWSYFTRRSFAYGHNTTAQLLDGTRIAYLRVAFSMARGALQAFVMALVALFFWALRHDKRAWAHDKMMRGLGKVLWFGPFRMGFYGAAAQKKLGAYPL